MPECGKKQKNKKNTEKTRYFTEEMRNCDGQEAFAIGIIDTIDETKLTSNRYTVLKCSVKDKGRPVLLCRFFEIALSLSLSLSLQASERVFTGIANKHAQESNRAMVGPPAPSLDLSRSKVCPQSVPPKNFFWDFSSEIRP